MLILASASPRRQELLRNAGFQFEVRPADVPEVQLPRESPKRFAERLAQEKARTVWASVAAEGRPAGNMLVLGADTIVVVDDAVLGKPDDAADAARMLRMLSGRCHLVTTSVCLIGPRQTALRETRRSMESVFEDVRSETTRVTMDQISEAEILDYVALGEPLDKAGAYAVQGVASRWVSKLEGCYFNVVGLPVPLLYRMLREHGMG